MACTTNDAACAADAAAREALCSGGGDDATFRTTLDGNIGASTFADYYQRSTNAGSYIIISLILIFMRDN